MIGLARCYRLVICLAWLIAAIGCTQEVQNHSPAHDGGLPKVEVSRERFDGFSFGLPSGWNRVAPDRPKTKAALLLGAERWDKAKAMIKVDVGPPEIADPRSLAEGLAKNFGGRVLPQSVTIDGEQAIQVQAPPGTGMAPRKALVVIRGGQAFLIMAGAIGDNDISPALEHVRTTWKWAN